MEASNLPTGGMRLHWLKNDSSFGTTSPWRKGLRAARQSVRGQAGREWRRFPTSRNPDPGGLANDVPPVGEVGGGVHDALVRLIVTQDGNEDLSGGG